MCNTILLYGYTGATQATPYLAIHCNWHGQRHTSLWLHRSIGGCRPGHTRAMLCPGRPCCHEEKKWLKLSNFSHKMKVSFVDNPPCPGSFCALQPPMHRSNTSNTILRCGWSNTLWGVDDKLNLIQHFNIIIYDNTS